MPLSYWQRQRKVFRRYCGYALVIAPVGFVFNVATTVTATPSLILVHALVMLAVAPVALTLCHALLDLFPAKPSPQRDLIVAIGAQILGMAATLVITAEAVERITGLEHLLAGPLFAACALVLSALVILTLVDAYRQREIALLRMQTLATEARYQSLNDQLQPHFLFNSLNVLAEAVLQDAKAGSEGILALARLYQAIVDLAEEKTVPLAVELNLIRDYLELMKLRFGDRLTVRIDAASVDLYVPPLAVFNLVENAVKHGVARSPGPAEIKVVADARGVRVENSPVSLVDGPRPGTGIANLNKRLELAFGGRASLALNVDSERAVAEIRFGDAP